jgi:hypothetical protein
MQVSGKLAKKENNISVDLSVPKSSQLKNKFIYRSLVLSLFVLVPLYIISLYASFGSQSVSGYAVYEQLSEVCKGYFGEKDTYCDDSPADCGKYYKTGSMDVCDECQTFKDGKPGFDKCVSAQPPSAPPPSNPPPTSGKCEDSDGGRNYWVKGTVNTKSVNNIVDSCSGNTVIENSCSSVQTISTEYYTCPDGCKDGACILLGDITDDGCVNIFDLVKVTNGFGTKEGDVNGDDIGNIFDLVLVANNLWQGWCKVLSNVNINDSYINDTIFSSSSSFC